MEDAGAVVGHVDLPLVVVVRAALGAGPERQDDVAPPRPVVAVGRGVEVEAAPLVVREVLPALVGRRLRVPERIAEAAHHVGDHDVAVAVDLAAPLVGPVEVDAVGRGVDGEVVLFPRVVDADDAVVAFEATVRCLRNVPLMLSMTRSARRGGLTVNFASPTSARRASSMKTCLRVPSWKGVGVALESASVGSAVESSAVESSAKRSGGPFVSSTGSRLGREGCRGVEVGRVDEAAADAELVEQAGEGVVPEAVGAEGEVGLVPFGEGLRGSCGWRQGLEGAVDVVAELVGGGVVGEGVVVPGGRGIGGGGGVGSGRDLDDRAGGLVDQDETRAVARPA